MPPSLPLAAVPPELAPLPSPEAELAQLRALVRAQAVELAQLRQEAANLAGARAAQQRLHTILDRMPGAVAYWDHGLVLRYANRKLQEHWADKPQPMVGRPMHELFSAQGLARTLPYVQGALSGHDQSCEHNDRSGVTAHVSYTPHLENGQVQGFVVLALDVSELKAARAAAEQASRAKSGFLASMSHEIRTPLNAVLGFAQLGAMQHHGDEAGRHFQHILQAGQHLLGLVNDVLDFSKIEAGKLQLEPGELLLADALEQALSLVRAQAQAKGLALSLEVAQGTPERWQADGLRVGQVLINLLTNAVKFTERGVVQLTVRADAQGLHLQVRDTGQGMDAQVMARLFQPFEQGDGSATRRVGGSGLGLSISKRLVDMMGGRITAHSQPGQGACFDVCLPLQTLPQVATGTSSASPAPSHATGPALPNPAAPAPSPLAGLRVLVAEDHRVNQILLEQFLSNEGARMHCVDNGVQAVEAVRQAGPGAFDLMLCDIEMPEMDGYQATEAIARIDPGLPVLGLTAHAFDDARTRSQQVGMVGYVTKPYHYTELAREMARHARRPQGT